MQSSVPNIGQHGYHYWKDSEEHLISLYVLRSSLYNQIEAVKSNTTINSFYIIKLANEVIAPKITWSDNIKIILKDNCHNDNYWKTNDNK